MAFALRGKGDSHRIDEFNSRGRQAAAGADLIEIKSLLELALVVVVVVVRCYIDEGRCRGWGWFGGGNLASD